MKSWSLILLTCFTFLGISTTVLLTGCEDDSCLHLTCKNKGTCADGYCRCPSGFEGAECEIKSSDRFVGRWLGTAKCSDNITRVDTLDIILLNEPDQVQVIRRHAIGIQPDVFVGKATSNRIIVEPHYNGNFVTNVNIIVEKSKIEMISETSDFSNPNNKDVCDFIGFK